MSTFGGRLVNLELSNERKLKGIIDVALQSANGSTDRDIVSTFWSEHSTLIEKWTLEKLCGLVRQRRKLPKSDSSQSAFPFYDLSTSLPLKDGPVVLRLATIGMLKQSVKFLSVKKKAAIDTPRRNSFLGKLEREIELMQPYVYGNRRITLEEVHELIARGTPPPPRGDGRISESMKRYWASMTPEERSAIAKRRESRKKRD